VVINLPVQNYRSKSGKIRKIPAKCEEIRLKQDGPSSEYKLG